MRSRRAAVVRVVVALAGVSVLVAGCGSDVPDLGYPQTWSVAKVGIDSWVRQGSSVTLDSDGTGRVQNVPLSQDGACWDGSQDTLTSSIVWKVVDEGVLEIEAEGITLEFEVDRQGLGSLNWEIIRMNLCRGVEGRNSDWLEYGTIL